MNYIQLLIGGKLRGLKFQQVGYITFYKYVDQVNFEATFHCAAVYAGLFNNAYAKREEFTDSFETVCDWVEEMSAEDKEAVLNLFNSTETFKQLVENGKAAETPKKKKLKPTTKSA